MAKCLKKDFIIFSLIGLAMTILNFALLAFFVEILKLNYIFSNIVSYIIVVIISYFANSFLTFNHKIDNSKKEVTRIFSYCVMKMLLLGIDTLLLYILVDKIKVNLYVSKIILTIVLTIGSFILSKKIIKGGESDES